MIDARYIDYSAIIDKVENLQQTIDDIKKDFQLAVSQNLFDEFNLKTTQLENNLDEIKYQLVDKNNNMY